MLNILGEYIRVRSNISHSWLYQPQLVFLNYRTRKILNRKFLLREYRFINIHIFPTLEDLNKVNVIIFRNAILIQECLIH